MEDGEHWDCLLDSPSCNEVGIVYYILYVALNMSKVWRNHSDIILWLVQCCFEVFRLKYFGHCDQGKIMSQWMRLRHNFDGSCHFSRPLSLEFFLQPEESAVMLTKYASLRPLEACPAFICSLWSSHSGSQTYLATSVSGTDTHGTDDLLSPPLSQ